MTIKIKNTKKMINKKSKDMTKFQEKVLLMELNNKMMNEFKQEVTFSGMGMDKHLKNLLYGVWSDDVEEESLLWE